MRKMRNVSSMPAGRLVMALVTVAAGLAPTFALADGEEESLPPGPPSMTSILVKSSTRCLVTVGGDHEVLLDPGQSKTFFLEPGDYEIVAREEVSRRVLWKESVELESGRIEVVRIDLSDADLPHSGPIFHGNGGLAWTREENRASQSWHDAQGHCSSINVAGFEDWRLPTAEELKSLCLDEFNDPGYRSSAIGSAVLACWTSSQAVDGSVEVVVLQPGCEGFTLSPSLPADVVCVRKRLDR